MFRTIIDFNNNNTRILNFDSLFDKKAPSFDMEPFRGWLHKAYKGEISVEDFNNWITKKVNFKNFTNKKSNTSAKCQKVFYFTYQMMRFEVDFLYKFTTLFTALEQCRIYKQFFDLSGNVGAVNMELQPGAYPCIFGKFRSEVAEIFYKTWKLGTEAIDTVLEEYKEIAKKEKNKEELLFLIDCYEKKALGEKCPKHWVVFWPVDNIYKISELKEKISKKFYSDWQEKKLNPEKISIYLKCAHQIPELLSVLKIFLQAVMTESLSIVMEQTVSIFYDLTSVNESTLMTSMNGKYSVPFRKLSKYFLPNVAPLFVSLPILFSEKNDESVQKCQLAVYKHFSWKGNQYSIFQNKKLINLFRHLPNKHKINNLNILEKLPYAIVSKLPILITDKGLVEINKIEDFYFNYPCTPLALAHRDLLGARTFNWEFQGTEEQVITKVMQQAYEKMTVEILQEYTKKQLNCESSYDICQRIENLFELETQIIRGVKIIFDKVKCATSLQNNLKKIIASSPSHLKIDNTEPNQPIISGFQSTFAKKFYDLYQPKKALFSVHHLSAFKYFRCISALMQDHEAEWLASYYTELETLIIAIKELMALKTAFFKVCKEQFVTVNAQKIEPDYALYHLMPVSTYAPLIYWYVDQLCDNPFLELKDAFEKADVNIILNYTMIEKAVENPENFMGRTREAWRPYLEKYKKEKMLKQAEMLPSIQHYLKILVPEFAQYSDLKIQKEDKPKMTPPTTQTRPKKIKKKKKKTKRSSPTLMQEPIQQKLTSNAHTPLVSIDSKNEPSIELSKSLNSTINFLKQPTCVKGTKYVEFWLKLNLDDSKENFKDKYESTKTELLPNQKISFDLYFKEEKARHAFPTFVDSLKLDTTYSKIVNHLEINCEQHIYLLGWTQNKEQNSTGEYVTFHFISHLSKGLNNKLLVGQTFHRYASNFNNHKSRFFVPEDISKKLLFCESNQLAKQVDTKEQAIFQTKNDKGSLKLFSNGFIEILDDDNDKRILLFPINSIYSR